MISHALLFLLLSLTTVTAKTTPPHYMQCDPKWGDDVIGLPTKLPEDSTICRVGCALSSLAMLLASLNTTTDWLIAERKLVTPHSLNVWLGANHGYDCVNVGTKTSPDVECFNLLSSAAVNLTGRLVANGYTTIVPSLEDIQHNLEDESMAYIAHVRDGHHFVLVTDVDISSNSIVVLDPGYNVTSYPMKNVSGVLSYTRRDQKVPYEYPTYKQCDEMWGNDTMVTTTVCKVGCLMSSTSMALAGHGVDVDGKIATPGTLNAWLKTHGGYDEHNDFEENVLPLVSSLLPNGTVVWPEDGMRTTNDIPWSELSHYLETENPRIVIANVLKGHHFVLVVGLTSDGDTIIVNDPGFNKTTYSYKNDVVGWRLFDMNVGL